MEKLDFKKTRANYFKASKNFTVEKFPKYKYLMVDGQGDPNTSKAFQEAMELLYSTAYTIKFTRKNSSGQDFAVMPTEGLWWAKNMKAFTAGDKAKWFWTMMIMMPDDLTQAEFKKAATTVKEKKGFRTELLRLDTLVEGLSVQYMHVGPYSEEGPKIAQMHDEFMPANKLAPTGKHHEIYLCDPRKSDPSKLKTIIRQPVKKL